MASFSPPMKVSAQPGPTIEIGGVLPLSGKNSASGLHGSLAISIALESIANNSDLASLRLLFPGSITDSISESDWGVYLPEKNFSLSYQVTSSQSQASVAVSAAYDVLTGTGSTWATGPVSGLIGSAPSAETIPISVLSSVYGTPQISFASTAPSLSDTSLFPNFCRVVPSDASQAVALSHLISEIGWKKLAVVYVDSTYGVGILSQVLTSARSHDITVSMSRSFSFSDSTCPTRGDNSVVSALQDVRSSGVSTILLVASGEDAQLALLEASSLGMFGGGSGYSWIGTDGWASDRLFLSGSCVNETDIATLRSSSIGVVGTNLAGSSSSTLPTVSWFLERWEEKKVSFASQHGLSSSYFDIPNPFSIYAFDATWVFAHAIDRVLKEGGSAIDSALLLAAVKATNFTGLTGHVAFNEECDRSVSVYDVWNASPDPSSSLSSSSSSFSVLTQWHSESPSTFSLPSSIVFSNGLSSPPPDTFPSGGGSSSEDRVLGITFGWFLALLFLLLVAILLVFLLILNRKKMFALREEVGHLNHRLTVTKISQSMESVDVKTLIRSPLEEMIQLATDIHRSLVTHVDVCGKSRLEAEAEDMAVLIEKLSHVSMEGWNRPQGMRELLMNGQIKIDEARRQWLFSELLDQPVLLEAGDEDTHHFLDTFHGSHEDLGLAEAIESDHDARAGSPEFSSLSSVSSSVPPWNKAGGGFSGSKPPSSLSSSSSHTHTNGGGGREVSSPATSTGVFERNGTDSNESSPVVASSVPPHVTSRRSVSRDSKASPLFSSAEHHTAGGQHARAASEATFVSMSSLRSLGGSSDGLDVSTPASTNRRVARPKAGTISSSTSAPHMKHHSNRDGARDSIDMGNGGIVGERGGEGEGEGRNSSSRKRRKERFENLLLSFRPISSAILLDANIGRLRHWDFDVFEFAKKFSRLNSSTTPAGAIGYALMERFRLFRRLFIPPEIALRFFEAVGAGYHSNNPFHNALHGIDVAQSACFFLSHSSLYRHLQPHEMLAVIIAAIGHDYDHPGYSNTYLVQTTDPLSLRYNDISVLENHHASALLTLLQKPEYNILSVLSSKKQRAVRQLVISLILATDLKHHYERINDFKRRMASFSEGSNLSLVSSQPSQPSRRRTTVGTRREFRRGASQRILTSDEKETEVLLPLGKDDILATLQMAIKCADLGHPAKKWYVVVLVCVSSLSLCVSLSLWCVCVCVYIVIRMSNSMSRPPSFSPSLLLSFSPSLLLYLSLAFHQGPAR